MTSEFTIYTITDQVLLWSQGLRSLGARSLCISMPYSCPKMDLSCLISSNSRAARARLKSSYLGHAEIKHNALLWLMYQGKKSQQI